MRSIVLVFIILSICFGCVRRETEGREQIAITRLHNAYDSIALEIMTNSNRLAQAGFSEFITESTRRDPLIKELLASRSNTGESILLLNTNVIAWQKPEEHAREIAIVLPDRIKKDTHYVGLAITFDRTILLFSCAPPD